MLKNLKSDHFLRAFPARSKARLGKNKILFPETSQINSLQSLRDKSGNLKIYDIAFLRCLAAKAFT